MKPLSAALKAHYALGTTTLASCWKATLKDGTVIGSTSLDQDIVFEGVTYVSAASYVMSNVESSLDLNPDNLEVEGFLASPQISEQDIITGRWDYARIEFFEVNYLDLSMGRNMLREGNLGQVKAGRSKFNAELRGLMQAYTRQLVRLTTKDCTAELGDSRCKINLAAYTEAGVVTTASANRSITATGLTRPSTWYTGGKVTFTSGLNQGLSMEVKIHTAPGSLELHEQMPYLISAGDTFTVHAGCTKRFAEDCKVKFNNILNFRGFPYVPGASIYGGP